METKNVLNFDKLIRQAYTLIRAFAEHDPKPWSTTVKTLDLMADSGKIAALVLEAEGYKDKKSEDTLPEELATLFFIILDIAQDYQIDFKESFASFLEKTEQQLTKKG
ncbi:hypothetical protein KW783_03105 [Candidatus Parcubacteria bacterium]|nr:hypothetical protein [Candidatus Parcubacteria bacterium]